MLDKLRLHVASDRSGLLELSILAVIVGIISAVIVITFRLIIEGIQVQFLPGGDSENYEALPTWLLFALPTLGGIFLGLLFQALKPEQRTVGVVHTIERLDYHQGRLPLANFLAQFLGAAIAIVTGHSVGREGPSIHFGAGCASIFGQSLGLPNNAIRILVGCGVAAAIAASFNTPIAGVVFTVEVIMLEYISFSLLPIILSAAMATVISQMIFGDEPLLHLPGIMQLTHAELPWVFITGIVIGLLGAAFIRLLLFFTELGKLWPIWIRLSLAGAFTGACAIIAPQVMSIGYDTVVSAMSGEIILATLLVIVLVKLAATTAGLGLGIPGGLIGPSVFIGATAGGTVGMFAMLLSPDLVSHSGPYALLGIGAMMAAVIQAPLAALLTMFELTQNPQILLPGLVVVAIAQLTTSQVFKQGAVFHSLLVARGLDYKNDPSSQTLRRIGVLQAMDTRVASSARLTSRLFLEKTLSEDIRWILVENNNEYNLMPAVDILRYLSREPEQENIDLAVIPATRLSSQLISKQASLQDAFELRDETGTDAIHVGAIKKGGLELYGILTEEDINAHYTLSPRRKIKRNQ